MTTRRTVLSFPGEMSFLYDFWGPIGGEMESADCREIQSKWRSSSKRWPLAINTSLSHGSLSAFAGQHTEKKMFWRLLALLLRQDVYLFYEYISIFLD